MDRVDAALAIKVEHSIDNNIGDFPIPNFSTLYIICSEDNDITKADPLANQNQDDITKVGPLASQHLADFVNQVGLPMMSVIESCRRNKATFSFPQIMLKPHHSEQFKKKRDLIMNGTLEAKGKKKRDLIINGTVVAQGGGQTLDSARHDASTKGLRFLLKAKQPVVYKRVKDIFLHENEAIPGLCLSYDDVAGAGCLTYPESVITKSCSDCQLDVQWYQIQLSDLFCAMLVIDSKIVYARTARKPAGALKLCAADALSYLETKQNKSQQQNKLNQISHVSRQENIKDESSSSELSPTSSSELPPTSSSSSLSELVPGLTLLLRSRVQEINLKVAEEIVFQSAKLSSLVCHAPGVLKTSGGKKEWSCDLQIGGIFIARGSHKQKKKARSETFRKGLELLLKTQHCKKYKF